MAKKATVKKSRFRNTVIVGVATLIVGFTVSWFLFMSPRLSEANRISDEATEMDNQAQSRAISVVRLRTQKKLAYSAIEEASTVIARMPANPDPETVITEITNVATAAGIQPAPNVQVSLPTLISGGNAPAADPAAAGQAAPADPATAAPADPANPSPAPTPTTPADAAGIGALAQSTVTITATCTLPQAQVFLKGLEDMPRAFLTSSVSFEANPERGNGYYTMSVTGTVYMLRTRLPELTVAAEEFLATQPITEDEIVLEP